MYAKPSCPAGCPCDVVGLLPGPHRVGARLVMILLSHQHWPPVAIAELLGCDPATVRRWIHRYNQDGVRGLEDRPRCGRPRLGSRRLGQRIRRLLAGPKAWTIARLSQRLGRPAMSLGTLHRRVREVARWRRPRLVANGTRQQVMTPGTNRRRTIFGAVERIWGALKAWLATSPTLTIQGRLRQVHAFFRQRSPTQILATAAPSSSPWMPEGYLQNFREAA